MFLKPFKVKSHSLMRNSDKRKLRGRLESDLGSVRECLDELISGKTEVFAVRVILHSGELTQFYCADGDPLFFESVPEGVLLPSVYALWKCPNLLPVWFTWPPVISKLCNGADLMLPGVILPKGDISSPLGQFEAGAARVVATNTNMAPVAVGVTALSSRDLTVQQENWGPSAGLRGKGILIRHITRDQLWAYGSKHAIPQIAPQTVSVEEVNEESEATTDNAADVKTDDKAAEMQKTNEEEAELKAIERLSLDESKPTELEEERMGACQGAEGSSATNVDEVNVQSDISPVEEMDQRLKECFLVALATRTPKTDLPLLTSTFYRQCIMPCCPAEQGPLDVKKTSFKKLSRFLAKMQQDGYLEVKETGRGVESVVDVNWLHPDVRAAKSRAPSLPKQEEDEASGPEVRHFMAPSLDLRPVFAEFGHAKDALLSDAQVREVITAYVKSHDLVSEEDRSVVCLNDVLSKALREKGSPAPYKLRWSELMKAVKSKMLSRHEVVLADGERVFRKGAAQPISITTALRSGNKTVTLAENVHLYGIDPRELAERMQRAVASSATVNSLPGKKAGSQVLIQGNVVSQLTDMLKESFGVPVQFIHCVEGKGKKTKGRR